MTGAFSDALTERPSVAAPSAQSHAVPPRLRRIFCVGMRRGGSTLQFQLARRLTESAFGSTRTVLVTPETVTRRLAECDAESEMKSETKTEADCVLLKCHRFLPEAAALAADGRATLLYVYRDIRDVVASIVRKYDAPEFAYVHGGLRSLLDENRQWESTSGIYIARYESMTADLTGEAQRLSGHLGLPLADGEAERIAADLSPARQRERIAEGRSRVGEGQNRYDPETLMHANHVRADGEASFRTLSPWTVAALEDQAADWLTARGYDLSQPVWRRRLAAAGFALRGRLSRLRRALSPPQSSDLEAALPD